MTAPKVFISYSWTSTEHEDWVLRLSTELRESGVDVILDKWDLTEGDEAHAFMERMVADKQVNKVVIICDKAYAEKSDTRKGGAGTEAQIISSAIYKSQKQDKFVVISTEEDSNGEPVIPTYYTSRIYIPFISVEKYSENFDQLLRWIFEQPLNKKPEIGSKPGYLDQEKQKIHLATEAAHRRAIDAIQNMKANAAALTSDYFNQFAIEMEKFRWPDDIDYLGEAVMENLDDFLPYRNQFLSTITTITRYTSETSAIENIHTFFESLIPYFYRQPDVYSSKDFPYDNFKFFGHEMFLLSIAICLKAKRFDIVLAMLENGYFSSNHKGQYGEQLGDYTEFDHYIDFFDHRNRELNLRRLSLHADLIKQRCTGTGLSHRDVMQADFLLFLRAKNHNLIWFPRSLVYVAGLTAVRHSFEIFVRSESANYFANILGIIGLNSKDDFDELIKQFIDNPQLSPSWQYERINVQSLVNHEQLCTKP